MIEIFNIKVTEYSREIETILYFLKDEVIDNVIIKKKCNKIGYNYRDKSKHILMIDIINKKSNFLPFVINKKEDEIRNLSEFVDDVDRAFLSSGDVKDLLKVIAFINELQKDTQNTDDKTFLEHFKVICDKYKDIELYFENVIKKLNEFKDLYQKIINKEEFAKKKIESLYTSSTYTKLNSKKEK